MNFLRDDGPLFGNISEGCLIFLMAMISCPVIAAAVIIAAMFGSLPK